MELLELIQDRASRRLLFLPHAVRQMSLPDRMISPADVRHVLEMGEIIEDYPEDPRGHSCLILGIANDDRPIHVVCAPKDDYLAVITAYIPEKSQWSNDFRRRAEA